MTFSQVWEIEDLQIALPEGVANNAVVEGFLNDKPYVFSFGGIDQTKEHGGIHLKSFRLDLENQIWESIDPLPDDMGKIAAGASTIGDTIYIIGGYHVFPNGSELSSNKVHRYSISQNLFLADGMDIPVPIDDHVQSIYLNRYIYIVTGWSNTTNVPDVQIYDTKTDTWLSGTPVPDNNVYKSFGASGAILGDTLYYFGGASFAGSFPIQNVVRKSPLNSENPTSLDWSHAFYSEVGYRMASIATENQIHWIGGSNTTYNFDGIAYNGTGGVAPNKQILSANASDVFNDLISYDDLNLPMDLRGIAAINDTTFIVAGGMEEKQLVSDKTIQITFHKDQISSNIKHIKTAITAYPNPCKNTLHISGVPMSNEILQSLIIHQNGSKEWIDIWDNKLDVQHLPPGKYLLQITHGKNIYTSKFIKA